MINLSTLKNLDGRDEFLLTLIAMIVPFASIGTLIA